MARQGGKTRLRRSFVAAAGAAFSAAAAFTVAGCGALPSPVLLHSSGEGVPGCHHCIELTFPSPAGERTAVQLEPYVCTVANQVRIDRVTLRDPSGTARLDRWGFHNGVSGGMDGTASTLEKVYATSHLVTAPCSAKWQQQAVLYVVVHRAGGNQPAAFYGVQLHYRSFGQPKTLTLDMGVSVCAPPGRDKPCPDRDAGS